MSSAVFACLVLLTAQFGSAFVLLPGQAALATTGTPRANGALRLQSSCSDSGDLKSTVRSSRRELLSFASSAAVGSLLLPPLRAEAEGEPVRKAPGSWAKRPKNTPFSEEELEGFTELDGGVKIKDITEGNGKVIGANSGCKMNYAGYRLADGGKFDNTWELGKQVGVRLGNKSVLPGLDLGMQGMKINGRRIIIIPPELAYKDKSVYRATIPPNSALVIYVQPFKEEYAFGPLESVNAFKIGALPEEKPKEEKQTICYDPNGCPGN